MKLVSVKTFYLILVCFIFSCTRDSLGMEDNICDERVTYEDNIKPIVDATCAYSGCHRSGAAPGEFIDYDGLSRYFGGGQLEQRVTVAQNMPPSNAPGPKELSKRELDLFKCWIDEGYPEN
ncbi:hypothetical protein [Portibacter marinus]|uniref:hypothetical protein n=1 Tax=Portibacter marinus TaxID=2898660 RepID=UPI001F479496|nr:hypothetical protein [Portibacter marinus]